MSNPFASIQTNDASVQMETDRLGGGFIWDSAAYEVTIKNAYAGVASSGANSMTYEVEGSDGRVFKWTEWVTSGTEKGCLPYYEKDGKKSYLPGFNNANALAMMTAKKELNGLTFESRMVKIRNKDTKTDVPTPTMVAVEMLGKKVILGIVKIETNKTQAVEVNGKKVYKRLAETRFENNVDKIFFIENKCTISELREAKKAGEAPVAAFYDKWVEQNEGKTQDRVKEAEIKGGGTAGGAPSPQNAAGDEVDSLFD